MAHAARHQADRQDALRDILTSGSAHTQQELVDALVARGFEATQSSVSRDLKDLDAVKTAAGYRLGEQDAAGEDQPVARVAELVRELRPAGPNLLVVTTVVGGAQRVALALDRSGWPEIVGSIGGDDTVFVATTTSSAQRSLARKIERAIARA